MHETTNVGPRFFPALLAANLTYSRPLSISRRHRSMNIGLYLNADLVEQRGALLKVRSSDRPSAAEATRLKLSGVKYEDFLLRKVSTPGHPPLCRTTPRIIDRGFAYANSTTLRRVLYYKELA